MYLPQEIMQNGLLPLHVSGMWDCGMGKQPQRRDRGQETAPAAGKSEAGTCC